MPSEGPWGIPQLPRYISHTTALTLLALVVALVAFSLFSTKSRSTSSSGKTVLLIGPVQGGKTALWSRLILAHLPRTISSAAINDGYITARWDKASPADFSITSTPYPPIHLALRKPIHLIDIPGSIRLRTRLLTPHLPSSSAIILPLDSTRQVREAAEHLLLLFTLLSILQARSSPTPTKLLILVTKVDTFSGTTTKERAVSRIQGSLEREFERRKVDSGMASNVRLEGLEKNAYSSSTRTTLASLLSRSSEGGKEGLPVDEVELLNSEVAADVPDWKALGVEVSWAAASAKSEGGLEEVWKWLETV